MENGTTTPQNGANTQGNGGVTPTPTPTPTPENNAAAAATGTSAADQAAMNKSAEEKALNEAAGKTDGSANVAGEGVDSELGVDVFFEGRKVVEILPKEMQNQPNFIHARMSDGTTVHVPETLFTEEDKNSINERAAKDAEDRAKAAREEADKAADAAQAK